MQCGIGVVKGYPVIVHGGGSLIGGNANNDFEDV